MTKIAQATGLSVRTVKLIMTIATMFGGLTAWSLNYFESKEHVATLKESRDKELDVIQGRLQAIDGKLWIIISRGK